MLNVSRLIDRVRRETRNEDNTNTVASDSLSDEEFIDALNDAQHRLQSVISNVYSVLFEKQAEFPVTIGLDEYTINDNVYLGNRIVCVEYTPVGNVADYRELENRDIKEREERSGIPNKYIRTSKKIIINPIPNIQTGKLRVTYEKHLSTLDKVRATVSSVGTPSGGQITITLAASPDAKMAELIKGDYITILDTFGAVAITNVRVVIISGVSLVIEEGDVVKGVNIDAGYQILIGKDATYTPDLPDICEPYLVAYACWQIFNRDDLVKAQRAKERLALIEEGLAESFSMESKDVRYIPIFDKGYY